ncbi:MAG: DEAD/DEAH box helicase, partial [Candidatus Methanomethylophilaceae archaeon]|nr:DEAD/DEAH box helicase [Candidatus Methanomethylophilaceae archaeon]
LMKNVITIRSFQKTYRSEKKLIGKRNGLDAYKKVLSLRDDVDRTWSAVFIDESHCIGAHNSVQTKAAITLSKLAKRRYIMTGTPVHGAAGRESFEKLYGQLQFLYQGRMWRNWTDFTTRYVTSWDRFHKPATWDVYSCHRLMQNHAIVLRAEDCLDLPGFTETDMPCIIDPKAQKIYRDIRSGNCAPYNVTIPVAGGQYLKLLQIVSGSCKQDDNGILTMPCSKDDMLIDILNGSEKRFVIFCKYRASVDRVADLCRKAKKEVLTFDGRTPKNGKLPWEQFNEGKGDVLVVQYASGSAGLNIQTGCFACIFFEPCLSALKLEQAHGRIYRSGQKEHCVYYYLVTKNTLEERVWREVREGRDVSNQTLIDWANDEIF